MVVVSACCRWIMYGELLALLLTTCTAQQLCTACRSRESHSLHQAHQLLCCEGRPLQKHLLPCQITAQCSVIVASPCAVGGALCTVHA